MATRGPYAARMATPPDRPSEHSRRHFLGLTGAAAGVATAASLLPPSLVKAAAQPRPAGSPEDIRHVIVLMQENRSFDHYFGTMAGVRGFADNSALPGVFDQDGVTPYRIRDAANRGELSVEWIASLPHNWEDGQEALHGGRCDRWISAKGGGTMACYDRADIPFQFALAEAFTVCDGYFCSCPTSTSPNRNYLWSGTTGKEPGSGQRAVDNDAYDPTHPGYEWRNYAEELTAAGVDWRVYQEWDNYTDNNLDFFRSFRDIGKKAVAAAGETGPDLTGFFDNVREGMGEITDAERMARAQRVHDAAATLDPAERDIYDRALYRGEPGSLIPRMAADIEAGTLSTVSWVVTTAADSEHPGASSPIQSSNITYRLLEVLAANEETWRHTTVLIMFDEFDGYYDHVVPPLPPTGEPDEWNGIHPMGLGFRVPMTVISPWSVGGRVSSEVFDHTSVLRFLEQVTGVACPNISNWRRAICGDLMGTLNFDAYDGLRLPEEPGPVPAFHDRWEAEPGGGFPGQETGQKQALPTPYRLAADVRDGRVVLVNDGPRAAVFAVFHGPSADVGRARVDHVTVADCAEVTLGLADAHVTVTGPDRFLRVFRLGARLPGRAASTPDVVLDHDGGRVIVDGRDLTDRVVRDGWYEMTLPGPNGAHFYTGRLESGDIIPTSPFRREEPELKAGLG